jgi:hypothetical protein
MTGNPEDTRSGFRQWLDGTLMVALMIRDGYANAETASAEVLRIGDAIVRDVLGNRPGTIASQADKRLMMEATFRKCFEELRRKL